MVGAATSSSYSGCTDCAFGPCRRFAKKSVHQRSKLKCEISRR